MCVGEKFRRYKARKIAAESDLMIVIGDKHSSNTYVRTFQMGKH